MTLGGLATLIRLVQDGFVQLQLAARPVAPPVQRPEAKPPAKPVPQPEIKPEIKIEITPGATPRPTPGATVEAKAEANPEPRGDGVPAEPTLTGKREPRLEPSVRLSGDTGRGAGPGPREPRFDRARPSEDGPARREPKLLRDS